MEDLILELKKKNIQFEVLSNGTIDCEDSIRLESIECLQRYHVYAYVDDFESGRCRHIISKYSI